MISLAGKSKSLFKNGYSLVSYLRSCRYRELVLKLLTNEAGEIKHGLICVCE